MNQLVENGARFSIDTQYFINRNKTLGHLGTRDLIHASILGIMGGFISSLVPFSLLVKTWYPFAGGTQLVSGHHLIWMVIAYGLVNKKAAILVTAFIKGMCEMLLGDQWGIIILLINLLEGISLSFGFWLMERLGEGTTKLGWGLAGGLGNFSQAPVFWLMTGRIFILDISLAILAFIFAFVSGCLLSGIFGRFIVLKVREGSLYSFKKYVECHPLGENYNGKASRRLEWTGDLQKDMESIKKCMAYPRNGSHENGSVVIDHVSFTYHGSDSPILAGIESHLQQGDTCIITGPSGSGKSTLCNLLSGLIPWQVRGMLSGFVSVFGTNLLEMPPRSMAGLTGYCMQDPDNQLVTLSVRDELVFGLENMKIPREAIQERLDEIVPMLDLDELFGRHIDQLSGGEKQRVILGAILAMKPRVLILDEPFAFLDLRGRMELMHYLRVLKRSMGNHMILVISEHRIAELLDIATCAITLSDGKATFTRDTGSLKKSGISRASIPEHIDMQLHVENDEFNRNRFANPHDAYYRLLQARGFSRSDKQDVSLASDAEILVCLQDVSYNYLQAAGDHETRVKQVLNAISCQVYPGEIIGLVGENGAGKSTLLHLIAGFKDPHGGTITWNFQGETGSRMEHASQGDAGERNSNQHFKNIGFIFQNPDAQLFKQSICEEILLAPRNFGIAHEILEDQMQAYYRLIKGNQGDLVDRMTGEGKFFGERNPFKLSWGQKRRTNLASLLSYNPSLFLLDEPFIGQDGTTIKGMMDLMTKEAHEGHAIIIASHDTEILSICDRVFLLVNGHLEVFGR